MDHFELNIFKCKKKSLLCPDVRTRTTHTTVLMVHFNQVIDFKVNFVMQET